MGRDNRSNNQQVAVLAPERMKMPEHVSEEYALTQDTWRALTDAVFPLAKTVGAVLMALAYCKKHRLDVFQRVVHIVPMYVGGRTVETVWPGIGQLRVIAQRQDTFAGYDECEFGEEETETFRGKKNSYSDGGNSRSVEDCEATVTYPTWAQFVVYKMLHGQRIRMPGPRVYFTETFASRSHFGGDVPNERWARAPRQMLEKCAEAAAYRRAFPDVLGNEMAAEEMEGRRLDPNGSIEAEYTVVEEDRGSKPKAEAKPAPKRSQFKQDKPAQQDDVRATDREVADEVRDEQAGDPGGEPEETSPLDRPGIPDSEEQWVRFERMLEERLKGLRSADAVDAEQEKQQFRIDAADLPTQQRLYAMFTDAAEQIAAGNEGGAAK